MHARQPWHEIVYFFAQPIILLTERFCAFGCRTAHKNKSHNKRGAACQQVCIAPAITGPAIAPPGAQRGSQLSMLEEACTVLKELWCALQASAAPAADGEKAAEEKAAADAAEQEAVATLRKSQEAAKDRESGEEASSLCLLPVAPLDLSILPTFHSLQMLINAGDFLVEIRKTHAGTSFRKGVGSKLQTLCAATEGCTQDESDCTSVSRMQVSGVPRSVGVHEKG